jgi:hypothetical protein
LGIRIFIRDGNNRNVGDFSMTAKEKPKMEKKVRVTIDSENNQVIFEFINDDGTVNKMCWINRLKVQEHDAFVAQQFGQALKNRGEHP